MGKQSSQLKHRDKHQKDSSIPLEQNQLREKEERGRGEPSKSNESLS